MALKHRNGNTLIKVYLKYWPNFSTGCSENGEQQPQAFSLMEKETSMSNLGDEEIRMNCENQEVEKNTITSEPSPSPHNLGEIISDLSVKRSSEDLLYLHQPIYNGWKMKRMFSSLSFLWELCEGTGHHCTSHSGTELLKNKIPF